MAADIGYGTTVTVGTGLQAEVYEVTWGGMERASVETTHLTTATPKTFIPSDIYDPGTLDFTLAFLPTELPDIGAATATTTIDWMGNGVNNKWAASMFQTSHEAAATIEERVESSVSMKVSGAITIS